MSERGWTAPPHRGRDVTEPGPLPLARMNRILSETEVDLPFKTLLDALGRHLVVLLALLVLLDILLHICIFFFQLNLFLDNDHI